MPWSSRCEVSGRRVLVVDCWRSEIRRSRVGDSFGVVKIVDRNISLYWSCVERWEVWRVALMNDQVLQRVNEVHVEVFISVGMPFHREPCILIG